MTAADPIRVIIVDDDTWIRIGRTQGLAEFDDIEIVASLPHDEAMDCSWEDIDVAVIDAHDSRQEWDRYPGVRVVEAVRRTRPPTATTVIVTSGRMFDPMLRLRMAEAGADYFYSHLDAHDPTSLADLIRRPDGSHAATVDDREALAEMGLRTWSRPNEALRWLERSGAAGYFTGSGTQKSAGVSRRALGKARDEVARLARIDPSLGDPERRPGDVTWRDVVKFVNRALGRDT